MSRLNKIKSFWEERGISRLNGELVTHRDIDQVKLEIDFVLSFIKKKDTLLDIGCGNGYSTFMYAQKCKRVVGIDYAQNMIKAAEKKYKAKNVVFKKQNVLQLDERLGKFSIALSTRCLIDLY